MTNPPTHMVLSRQPEGTNLVFRDGVVFMKFAGEWYNTKTRHVVPNRLLVRLDGPWVFM